MFVGSGCQMSAHNGALRNSELKILFLTSPLISHTLIIMLVYKNNITIQLLQNWSQPTWNYRYRGKVKEPFSVPNL